MSNKNINYFYIFYDTSQILIKKFLKIKFHNLIYYKLNKNHFIKSYKNISKNLHKNHIFL